MLECKTDEFVGDFMQWCLNAGRFHAKPNVFDGFVCIRRCFLVFIIRKWLSSVRFYTAFVDGFIGFYTWNRMFHGAICEALSALIFWWYFIWQRMHFNNLSKCFSSNATGYMMICDEYVHTSILLSKSVIVSAHCDYSANMCDDLWRISGKVATFVL